MWIFQQGNPVAGRAVVARERVHHRPPMPASVNHVGPTLDRYLPAAEIYRGEVQASDGSIGVIFGSQQMLQRLNDVVELFVDGTFQAVPNEPRFMQLLIIHCRRLDMGLPALFILCERRTTAMYESIWDFIIDRSPNMLNNLKFVSGDFEKSSIQGIRNKLPNVIFRGCWFHFTRAVTRRWRRLHLNRAPDLVLRLTWVLPLVPAHLFREAFNEIQSQARRIEQNHPRIHFFITYIQNYWLPQADKVSTRNSVIRTNNVAEAFNRQLITRLGGGHLDLFLFLERLTVIIKDEEIKWLRLDEGHDLTAERRAYQSSVDSRIINYQTALDRGRFTVAEFLHAVGLQRVQVAIQDANLRLDGENFDSDDEMPLLRDLADPVNAAAVIPENPLPPVREARRRRRRGARRAEVNLRRVAAVDNNVEVNGEREGHRPRGRPRGRGGARQFDVPPFPAAQEPIQPDPIIIIDADDDAVEPANNRHGNIYDRVEVNDFENDQLAEGNAGTCVVCLLNLPKVIVIPCFHFCLCFRCNFARQIVDNDQLVENLHYRPRCPVCRGNVESTQDVFVS